MVFLNLKESPKGLLSGPVCVNYSSEIPELMIWHRKMRRRGEAVEVKELLSRNLKLSSQGLSCFSPPSPSYTHPIKESCPYYKSIGPFLSVDSLTLSFRLGESWGKAWNSASSATAMLRRSTAAVAEQYCSTGDCQGKESFQLLTGLKGQLLQIKLANNIEDDDVLVVVDVASTIRVTFRG